LKSKCNLKLNKDSNTKLEAGKKFSGNRSIGTKIFKQIRGGKIKHSGA